MGNAIALNSAQFNLGRILGPAAAGLLIGLAGESPAFWVNAISFVAVIVALSAIRTPGQAAIVRAEAGLWSNLADGIRFVRGQRILLALLALAAAPAVLLMPYLALLPLFAQELGIGAAGLGLLTAAIGVGALCGALGVAFLRQGGTRGRTLLAGLVAMAVSLAVFAMAHDVVVACLALAAMGAAQVAYYTSTNTLVQLLSPGRLRGRILSIYVLTSIGLTPLGNLAAGLLAQAAGAPLTLVAGGVLTMVALAAVLAWCPSLPRLHLGAVETPEGLLKPSPAELPQEG
jgi:MFS family permease